MCEEDLNDLMIQFGAMFNLSRYYTRPFVEYFLVICYDYNGT